MLGQIAPAHFLADLGVQFAHRPDAAVIEVLSENERPRHGGKIGLVAVGEGLKVCGRHDPRFDPGVAFPFAPVGDQILLEGVETHRQRTAVAPGSQAHVDAEHAPVPGWFVEAFDQTPSELGKIFVAGPSAGHFGVFRIDKNQVDVGGHVELATAELAHAHDQHARARIADLCAHGSVAYPQRGRNRHLGQGGHGARHLGEVGESAEVAQRQAQHHPLAQAAQGCGQRCFVGLGVRLGRVRQFSKLSKLGEHFGALERVLRSCGEFARKFRTRHQQALRVAGMVKPGFEVFHRGCPMGVGRIGGKMLSYSKCRTVVPRRHGALALVS